MRRVMIWGVLAVAGVIATGCGGDDGVSINTTQDNLCAQVAQVACHNMYQCCSEGEIEKNLDVSDPRDEAGCRSDFEMICDRQMADVQLSLKNKHVAFNPDVMNKCLEAIVAPGDTCATVASMAPWTDACMTSAFTPKVAANAACDFAFECVKDTYCRQDRQCIALPTAGQDCLLAQAAGPCASGLYCDAQTNKCAAQLTVNTACTAETQCGDGLFCDDVGAAATGTCVAQRAIGQVCEGAGTCTDGNVCLPGTCQNSLRTCFSADDCDRHCAISGNACNTDAQCGTGTCSTTTTTLCVTNTGCPTGETCVFPEKCAGATCEGNVVCAAAHVTVDYCEGALQALPL